MQVVTKTASQGSVSGSRSFGLKTVPMALTCGLYSGRLIADPTSEEEALTACLVSTIVDASGCLIGESCSCITPNFVTQPVPNLFLLLERLLVLLRCLQRRECCKMVM